MIALTVAEVAAAVGGTVVADGSAAGDVVVDGPVVVDSRLVGAGSLFVAVAGERADGHDHVPAALAGGAVAALVARPVPGAVCVVVPDVVVALGLLAREVLRRRPDVAVVGVTGSSGKTSTKDLLAQVLATLGPTVAPEGSFNNDIGLPLTVLRVDDDTAHLVLEYSARGVGHIARLCEIAPPRVAAVLNVGSAHAGEFGGREVTARAKSELVRALPEDGLAVLNADDPLVMGMAEATAARVVTVGSSATADVHPADVRLDDQGRASFTLVCGEESAEVALRLHGEHHVGNALSVAALALELGAGVAQVARALSDAVTVSRWRMEVTERADGVTVVNDAYNANPESVGAALKALVAMTRGRRRAWAVLGEMGELGDEAVSAHDAVGRLVVRLNVDRLLAVGPASGGAGRLHAGAVLEGSWGEESLHAPDIESALVVLRRELRPGDVVLVKASRSVGLERLATALLADSTTHPDTGQEVSP